MQNTIVLYWDMKHDFCAHIDRNVCHILPLTMACTASKHWECYFLEILLSENMVSVYIFFFFSPCAASIYFAAEADVMAIGLRSRAGRVLQQKAAVKLASIGPNGDSKQHTGQVR